VRCTAVGLIDWLYCFLFRVLSPFWGADDGDEKLKMGMADGDGDGGTVRHCTVPVPDSFLSFSFSFPFPFFPFPFPLSLFLLFCAFSGVVACPLQKEGLRVFRSTFLLPSLALALAIWY
jgi:hypothetical protein